MIPLLEKAQSFSKQTKLNKTEKSNSDTGSFMDTFNTAIQQSKDDISSKHLQGREEEIDEKAKTKDLPDSIAALLAGVISIQPQHSVLNNTQTKEQSLASAVVQYFEEIKNDSSSSTSLLQNPVVRGILEQINSHKEIDNYLNKDLDKEINETINEEVNKDLNNEVNNDINKDVKQFLSISDTTETTSQAHIEDSPHNSVHSIISDDTTNEDVSSLKDRDSVFSIPYKEGLSVVKYKEGLNSKELNSFESDSFENLELDIAQEEGAFVDSDKNMGASQLNTSHLNASRWIERDNKKYASDIGIHKSLLNSADNIYNGGQVFSKEYSVDFEKAVVEKIFTGVAHQIETSHKFGASTASFKFLTEEFGAINIMSSIHKKGISLEISAQAPAAKLFLDKAQELALILKDKGMELESLNVFLQNNTSDAWSGGQNGFDFSGYNKQNFRQENLETTSAANTDNVQADARINRTIQTKGLVNIYI